MRNLVFYQKVNQIHSIDEAYKILELRREVLDVPKAPIRLVGIWMKLNY